MTDMIGFNLKGLSKDQMEVLIPSLAEQIETDDNIFKIDVVTSHLIEVAIAVRKFEDKDKYHLAPSEEALIVLFENGADHVMLNKVMRSKFREEGPFLW